jgi:hypothetical protein
VECLTILQPRRSPICVRGSEPERPPHCHPIDVEQVDAEDLRDVVTTATRFLNAQTAPVEVGARDEEPVPPS